MLERAKAWARHIKRDIAALWLAARDPRTPRGAKYLAMALVAYALSPIDLIPDFVPVLGLLDDLLILPLGILALLRMMPMGLMDELREKAAQLGRLPSSRAGLAFIIVIWVALLIAMALWLMRRWL